MRAFAVEQATLLKCGQDLTRNAIRRADSLIRVNIVDLGAYIHADPDILVGKPVVKGTRLAVDFILSLLANGWTQQQILESYPSLTIESLRAIFTYPAPSEI